MLGLYKGERKKMALEIATDASDGKNDKTENNY